MANFLLPIVTFMARRAKAKFVKKTRQTDVVQEEFLFTLLRAYQDTELGRQYGLSDIKTIQQFRDRVPILPYSSYEPYLKRIAQGEPNVLTPDPVVYLNSTSGSTGKQKLIPETRRSRQIKNRAQRATIGFTVEAAR